MAAFAIGTRLAQLNGGVLNAVLGRLLGANLSLSVMDYNALASANIDLFQFSNALATRVGLKAVTYGDLVAGNFALGDVLNAAAAAPSIPAGVKASIQRIAAATTSSSTSISLRGLVSFGPYATQVVGGQPFGVALTAFDLVNAVAQIANGSRQIEVGVDAGIPGLANVTLALAVGERPVYSSLVTVGEIGASVHTAQTRLLVTVTAGVSGLADLTLPLYLELAGGTATLSSVQCATGLSSPSATLNVTPSLANAWIGTVNAGQMTNFSTPATASPAPLLTVNLLLTNLTVSALANANIGNLGPTPVSFSYADIQGGVRKTTGSTQVVGSLLTSLVGNTRLSASTLGLTVALPPELMNAVGATLGKLVSPLDQLLAGVLALAGVGLGQADTWVAAAQCGGTAQARLIR
jgi:uncharacterized membrane protein